MFERFHQDARQTVVRAQEEARLLAHDYIGTEHLLLSLTRAPEATAGRVLLRYGLDHDRVSTQLGRLLAARPADDLDAGALETIGIDLSAVKEKVEAVFGPGALDRDPHARRGRPWRLGGHIPFTGRAKKVLELSLRESLRLGHKYIGDGHILLGLLREGEGLAARIIADAGVHFDTLREEIRVELG
ncbi:Clp protease N-terminal domain-containing protein [Sphaerisporangium fuscum]|uniref:Clp protease N-terminal domain-containing protein n=1 Tax=Sphaerisporangium fuscum TaxID=2835868 RepID=UPI00254366F9|nr:Clp protease N-terminal domain-containing protein [Sphaerisporangium fuscum]